MIDHIDFADYRVSTIAFLLTFLVVYLRYLLLSGAYHWIFFMALKQRFGRRMLFEQRPKARQVRRELVLSLYSGLIFSAIGLLLLVLWQKGHTRIYSDLGAYPLWYVPVSIIIYLFLHDTYYYWLHKWMHTSKWIRRFHMEHHRSVDTTVFTSFSFHPVESLLQAIIVPVLLVVVPMSLPAILVCLLFMTFSAIVNHGGVEIYPRGRFFKNFGKYVIGATHHDIHHRNARKNLGLYFTFWDRIMKTEA